jgi:DnaK suppressor protein
MPRREEPDELTGAQTAELQEDMVSLRAQLTHLLEISKEDSKPVDLDLPIGRISRMDAMQQQSMAKAGRAANERRLALLGTALRALKEDDYGFCRECEDPVGFGRLKARPETPFCVECQGAREKLR